MKLLIVGCGVIGSLYAVYFSNAGYEVTVLARGKRLQQLINQGLLYEEHKVIKKANVTVIEQLHDYDIYDYIFVVVKAYQIHDALKQLKPNVSKTIVTMVNTADAYSFWQELCGKTILPAFPGAGGNLDERGVLKASLTPSYIQKTTFGRTKNINMLDLQKLEQIFKTSKIPYEIVEDMHVWQVCHLAMVVPLANAYYISDNPKRVGTNFKVLNKTVKQLKDNFKQIKEIHHRLLPKKMNYFLFLPKSIIMIILSFLYASSFGHRFMYQHSINASEEMKYLKDCFYNYLHEQRTSIDN